MSCRLKEGLWSDRISLHGVNFLVLLDDPLQSQKACRAKKSARSGAF
jgi:hypothetical protein